jgi:hypothetical protein
MLPPEQCLRSGDGVARRASNSQTVLVQCRQRSTATQMSAATTRIHDIAVAGASDEERCAASNHVAVAIP